MTEKTVRLFLCGDVMTGRGIDQILPSPSNPALFESYVTDARDYVKLAEEKNGYIPKPVDFAYIWGDALTVFKQLTPDLRIINLETSVTTSNDYWENKSIHYRMNPKNVPCLTVAHIDCCTLANNHTLDWGYHGLTETVETLHASGIKTAGAGENIKQAQTPAVLNAKNCRVLIFSFGAPTSGVPWEWRASEKQAGINLLKDFSQNTLNAIKELIRQVKQQKDFVIFSIHWGSNWGYHVPVEQREFAHKLIDEAQVDLIHGHSSHHEKGIEVYNGKLILYGCGDFFNDYEGIGGYEEFRSDLSLMYFVDVETSNMNFTTLHLAPTQIRRFKINYASKTDSQWLKTVLNRENRKLGTPPLFEEKNRLVLKPA